MKRGPITYSPDTGLVQYTLPEYSKTALVAFKKELVSKGYRCWCGKKMEMTDEDTEWNALYQAVVNSPFPPTISLRYLCHECFAGYTELGLKMQNKKRGKVVTYKFKLKRRTK